MSKFKILDCYSLAQTAERAPGGLSVAPLVLSPHDTGVHIDHHPSPGTVGFCSQSFGLMEGVNWLSISGGAGHAGVLIIDTMGDPAAGWIEQARVPLSEEATVLRGSLIAEPMDLKCRLRAEFPAGADARPHFYAQPFAG
jgi:hypothetical protein